MNFYWIANILEEEEAEEKRKYELKNSDHGVGLLNAILSLPNPEFKNRFRMNKETFLCLAQKVILNNYYF